VQGLAGSAPVRVANGFQREGTSMPPEVQKVSAEIPTKSYREILREEIETGSMELERPRTGLLLSGFSAGLDIGFSLLMMAVMLTHTDDVLAPALQRILLANMYAVGFIFVNLGRSELFTEHTTLMVFPVLDRHVALGRMLRVWLLVYLGNLAGGTILAGVVALAGPSLGIIHPPVFADVAKPLVHQTWWAILISGSLAGWMMGLLSWLTAATQDTMSRILCVWLVTASIGFAELHHCIAGSVEVLAAVFSQQGVGLSGYAHFLLWATMGNVLGGVFFATLKYAHAVRTRPGPVIGHAE
jgi:formate/nitrite transporter FocA (FNT family)